MSSTENTLAELQGALPMSSTENTLAELLRKEYEQRIVVDRLRREVYQQTDPSASPVLLEELNKAEQQLQAVEQQRSTAQEQRPKQWVDSGHNERDNTSRLGSTGLQAKVHLNMAHVPTSICHLLDRNDQPLITCEVTAAKTSVGKATRRVRSFRTSKATRLKRSILSRCRSTRHNLQATAHPVPDRGSKRSTSSRERRCTCWWKTWTAKSESPHVPDWLPGPHRSPQRGRRTRYRADWLDLSHYCGAWVTPHATR